MSLGVGAYKVGGAGQCSNMRRRYPWQPCERPPPGTITLNNSVEYLPTQYLPIPYQEGGTDGKNQSTNWHANSKLLQEHFAKNCKQATVYISHEVPLLEASGHLLLQLGKQLTSIASRLTLPKLHLATFISYTSITLFTFVKCYQSASFHLLI